MLDCLAPPNSLYQPNDNNDNNDDFVDPLVASSKNTSNGDSMKPPTERSALGVQLYDFCGKYMKNCFTPDIDKLVKKHLMNTAERMESSDGIIDDDEDAGDGKYQVSRCGDTDDDVDYDDDDDDDVEHT